MKKIVIANWKMNMSLAKAKAFARGIKTKQVDGVEIVLAPSYVCLPALQQILGETKIGLAAQDVAAWPQGSYTGEVSGKMVREVGGRYVIIGHSERRTILEENNELIHAKMEIALANRLQPILCVGETAKEKKSGKRETVLLQQVKKALSQLPNLVSRKLVLAYEPVWAIGSGNVVTVKDLEQAYRIIKRAVSTIASSTYFDEKVRFVYGGSVKPDNVDQFWALPYIDGVLVGGASLQLKDFLAIAQKA